MLGGVGILPMWRLLPDLGPASGSEQVSLSSSANLSHSSLLQGPM